MTWPTCSRAKAFTSFCALNFLPPVGFLAAFFADTALEDPGKNGYDRRNDKGEEKVKVGLTTLVFFLLRHRFPYRTSFPDRCYDFRTMSIDWNEALATIVRDFGCDSGTVHLLAADGLLHLTAHTPNIPPPVLDAVRTVPVGKGMAGLAVERRAAVDACNIQTDTSGDVRPGARATGLQGAIVVPILKDGTALGALGVANFRERVFAPHEVDALLAKAAELIA